MRFGSILIAGLLLCGCQNMHKGHDECCEGKEEDGVEMKLSEIPAAAREGLMREAGGAKIEEVDKETRDGKTVYETDVKIDGKTWEIIVDGNGNKISKKLDEDEEEDEKNGKEEKEDDDDKK